MHGVLFDTTRWSIVLKAGQQDLPEAAEALEKLCRSYWYPLYVYVRRQGYAAEDAKDLTQAFFAHLLRKNFLSGVGPEKGRFRSFLLTCLKHFLVDEWEKGRSAKRGGGCVPVLVDSEHAEARYLLEGRPDTSAEHLYERRWALEILGHVLNQLRDESAASGKQRLFDELQPSLLGECSTETYAQLGSRLGMSETGVKVAVHRLRQRYRELLREDIAHTVTRPEEVEQEMRYLFAVVSR